MGNTVSIPGPLQGYFHFGFLMSILSTGFITRVTEAVHNMHEGSASHVARLRRGSREIYL
jgi:hypothetical protein